MAFLRCGVCNVDIHENFFVAHKQKCKAEPQSGLGWIKSNLKRYFSPGGTTPSQGGRPLKRLKTTPTSFGLNKPSTPTNRSALSARNGSPILRVNNSPFSLSSRGSSPFNARTPHSTPYEPQTYDHLPEGNRLTLAYHRHKWQQHLGRLSSCVTDSYKKNPDWDDRFWDAIAYPSVVYLLPFLQTLRIYEFEYKDLANNICILQFDIAFGFDESRRLPALHIENYWNLVKRLKDALGGQQFRLQGKYCSNIDYDRTTHDDRRQNNFFSREWKHENESFPSTVALATHLHSLSPDLPFKWTDVLRIWLRFAHKKIYDEEIEKDKRTTEPVNLEDKDSEYEPETEQEEAEESDEEDSEPIPPELLKKIQEDYYAYKDKWKKRQQKPKEDPDEFTV